MGPLLIRSGYQIRLAWWPDLVFGLGSCSTSTSFVYSSFCIRGHFFGKHETQSCSSQLRLIAETHPHNAHLCTSHLRHLPELGATPPPQYNIAQYVPKKDALGIAELATPVSELSAHDSRGVGMT
jgi:hypothetical protein